MDKETIDIYNREAVSIAQLHSTLIPHRIYELINQYFIKGEKTADIGCGIGRDTHWLTQQGFPSIGIDASKNMLQQAKSLYPSDNFFQDELPEDPVKYGLTKPLENPNNPFNHVIHEWKGMMADVKKKVPFI